MQKRGGAFGGSRGEGRGGGAVELRKVVAEPLPDLVRGNNELIPEKTRRDFAKLAEHFAPYEGFARSIRSEDHAEYVALFEILEDAGVVNADLIKTVRSLSRDIAISAGAAEEKFYKGSRWRLEKANVHTALVDEQFHQIEWRAHIERRQLFELFFREVMRGSYVFSIMRKIKRFEKMGGSFSEAMSDTEQSAKDGIDSPEQAAVVDWFRFTQSFGKQKRILPPAEFIGGATPAQAFNELKQVTFDQAVGGKTRKVALTGVRWRDSDIFCDVSVAKDQSPYIICELRLVDGNGIHVADGYLSRITGEITVSGTLTVSAHEVFSFFQAEEKYKRLKDITLAAVYRLWKEKDLQEEATVDVNMADGEDEDGLSIDTQETQGRIPTREEGMRAFREQFGDQSTKRSAKERRIEEGELSRFSWRRVMDALSRCGVTVELDHDHPKLHYKNKTMSYINRHEPDPRRNRAVVNRVLREFGIPRDEFKKKLW